MNKVLSYLAGGFLVTIGVLLIINSFGIGALPLMIGSILLLTLVLIDV